MVDIGTRAKGKLYAWKQGVLVFNLTMPIVSRMGLRLLPFDVYCPSVTADNYVLGTQCIQDGFTKLMEFNMSAYKSDKEIVVEEFHKLYPNESYVDATWVAGWRHGLYIQGMYQYFYMTYAEVKALYWKQYFNPAPMPSYVDAEGNLEVPYIEVEFEELDF